MGQYKGVGMSKRKRTRQFRNIDRDIAAKIRSIEYEVIDGLAVGIRQEQAISKVERMMVQMRLDQRLNMAATPKEDEE